MAYHTNLLQNSRYVNIAIYNRGIMVTIKNIAKEKLNAGAFAIGVELLQARTVDIAKVMKTAGVD
jgi:hypothetical protein